jgi:A/G-specific adenine glycosylase
MNTLTQEEMTGSAAMIARDLLRWFDRAQRDLPWRRTRDPYAIWLSEIMLQQTQVATVVPYYERFLGRFPTVSALAAAELSDVLSLWAGLGYYRRAKHLHRAAREMVARHGGRVPGTLEELLALPGIGRYTAGAIGSMAFGLPAPVVDGNVMRVLARVYGYEEEVGGAKARKFFWERAGEWVRAAPRERSGDTETGRHGDKEKGPGARRHGDVNQAVMELGATVCVPAGPRCEECPLRDSCVARKEERQRELPVKGAKKKAVVVRRQALVILRQRGGHQEVLMMERPEGGLWEHMWEFPTVAAGDKDAGAAGLKLSAVRSCGVVKHQLTHRRMEYEVIAGRMRGGAPAKLPACDAGKRYVAARWVAWPFCRRAGIAVARVVEKVAEVARRALLNNQGA